MARLLALTFAFILALSGAALWLKNERAKPALQQARSSAPIAAKSGTNSHDTEITRDGSGQFHLNAVVNGEDARFLLDTGADMVALTVEEAERLGIEIDRESFRPVAQTASGPGYGATIRIERIQIAGQEFRDVDAIVINGLGTNLLGQSLLKRLGRMEMENDKMVFRGS